LLLGIVPEQILCHSLRREAKAVDAEIRHRERSERDARGCVNACPLLFKDARTTKKSNKP